MLCCLNPDCPHPINPDDTQICQGCNQPLTDRLRDRYRPTKLIGQGGFGRTYLAQDTDRLDASCVIKQFNHQNTGDGSFEKALRLFNQEALRLNELGEHSQIPTLLAYFEQNNRLYLVQQVIEGRTLAQEVQHKGTFTEAAIRDLLADLLPLLQFIHDRNVIHRDINPTNIIRRKIDGKLVLIDFGIAKQLEASLGEEEDGGTRIGTEGYSPIEQLRSGEAYPSSDLYSLGATCLFLLTGSKPEKLYSALEGRWRWREKLQESGRSVSPQLGELLDRLVQDLIRDRYPSARDVLNDLLDLPSMPQSVPGWTRQHTGKVSDPISGSNSGKSLFGRVSKSDNRPKFSGTRNTHRRSASRPTSSQPTSRPRTSQTRSGQPTTRGPKTSSTYIQSTGGSVIGGNAKPSRWEPIRNFEGHNSWVSSVAINPQIALIASGGFDDVVNLWNLKTGAITYSLKGHTRGINGLAFSPQGQLLVSCSDDQTIKVWNVGTGKLLYTLQGHARDVTSVAIGARGVLLVSGSEDRTIRVWKLDRGSPLKVLSGDAGMIKCVAITPDDKTIISGGFDNKIRLWQMPSGDTTRVLSGHLKSISDIALSRDGRLLASASKDKTIRLWSLRSGNLIHTLQGHTREVNSVAITPDQRTVVSAGGDSLIKVWDAKTGELIETLMEHHSSITSVAIDAGGRYMVSASSDKMVKLWQRKK